MKKLLVLLIAVIMIQGVYAACTNFPEQVSGALTIGGVDAPIGTEVRATLLGEISGNTTTTIVGQYVVTVIPQSQTEGDGTEPITFEVYVDGVWEPTDQSTVYSCGIPESLDLSVTFNDNDGDGYTADVDCNDDNAAVNPGATEVCNEIDDDCDTLVDEGVQTTFYQDSDDDTYGNPLATTLACTVPVGYSQNSLDCDDGDGNVNPAATEICNLVDDDCDSLIDEEVQTTFYQDNDGDGFGTSAQTSLACTTPIGYANNDLDCDDTSSSIYPGAPETCNLVDDDCDTLVDEDVQSTFYYDSDGDSYGDALATTLACTAPTDYVADNQDCDDNNWAINPGATEVCNALDDDCDTLVDEGVQTTYYYDSDGDGYGDASVSTSACTAPTDYVTDNLDCDDGNGNVNPAAIEICNLIDDDCDVLVDEEVTTTYYRDSDGDGYGDSASATQACALPDGYVTNGLDCDDTQSNVNPDATEICDGIDNNCAAGIDETGNALCDNGLYCDGAEYCDGANGCKSASAVDCSGNDISIGTCNYTPDANGFTYDEYSFTSSCDETLDACTTAPQGYENTISHSCDILACGAQCEEDADCADTSCNQLDGCVGSDYYDYDNVANSCDSCACTQNACSAPTITKNDARCTECQSDADCAGLTRDYCVGTEIWHDEGVCVNFACTTSQSTVENCADSDSTYCSGSDIVTDSYTCSDAACVFDATDVVQLCNDGLYCNGEETCSDAACVAGTTVDCSANDIALGQCDYNPDGNSLTYDQYSFASSCDETQDACTTAPIDWESQIESECSFDFCGAACTNDGQCSATSCNQLDGCVGSDYYDYDDVANSCDSCACTQNACSAPTITANDARCIVEEETYPYNITIYQGWTLFSLPYQPVGVGNTEQLGQAIMSSTNITCDVVMTYDGGSQKMIDDILGLADPSITLAGGSGYFIFCDSAATYAYSGTLWG